MQLDQLYQENAKCPNCNKSIKIVSGESYTCDCGWKKDPSPEPGTYHQFGQRYSELARMRPTKSFPGINAGRVS